MTKKAAATKVDTFAFWLSNYEAWIKLNVFFHDKTQNKDSTLKANFVIFTDHCVIIITFYDNWMAQLWPFHFISISFPFSSILITMWEISFGTASRYIQESTTHSHKECTWHACSRTLLFEANLLLDSSSFFNPKVSILIEGKRTYWMVKTLFHLHAMQGRKKRQ